MAREKLPRNQLSRTAEFYRDNPEANEKHKQTSRIAAMRPARKRKNAETRRYRRNNGMEGQGGGDVHHKPNGQLQVMSASKNRRIK
tara:strand:+ start:224 stop:481 length:258 start_codon:yes stop_codon:yes gene_type:complete